jgi:hypothetical protein
MATRGKTINIFIPDSNPRGVKICDIQNSIVKAIYIPRNKLEEVTNREDLKKPGIYFIFGLNEESMKPLAYIGEAETLITRLKQHNISKDFWNTAICFVSEKNNINKAHIKYLESLACLEASRIGKCDLENSTSPTQSSLTEQDEDFVLSFYDDLKVLLTTLGYPIFEESMREKKDVFICKGKDAYAEGEYTENGMTVFKGSKIRASHTKGLGSSVKQKEIMIEKGLLQLNGESYLLSEDFTFTSPSSASGTILGRSSNGWTDWKTEGGETLDERYRK